MLPLHPGQVINSASTSSLTLHCIRVKSLPLDPGQSSPIIITITSRSGPVLSSWSSFILPLHPGQVLCYHCILVKFYISTASWSSFILPLHPCFILPLHPGQVLYYHCILVLYFHCILVRFYYCIIIRSYVTSVLWSIRHRRSLVKFSTCITNLVKSYITTSFWSGHYHFILSSPILPLYLGQVIPHHPSYHCTLVKSFHIILLKSNITTTSWSSHST